MAAIAYKILTFESMIQKPILKNHAFFAVVTFNNINSFVYINSVLIQNFQYLFFKKSFININNLSYFCLHFYKDNCLNLKVVISVVYK